MLIPVILAGGSGTRLWPVSREARPKQFLNLEGTDSCFQQTLLRLEGLATASPITITNEEHRFIVAEQTRALGLEGSSILLEPVGRNTAPAIALAAFQALLSEEDPVLLVLAADHHIGKPEGFRRAVSQAEDLARQDRLVTFGVLPGYPATGYGYIRCGTPLGPQGFAAEAFVEKPDHATAQSYIDSGNYYWNSGMFLFRARVYLDALNAFCPEIFQACTEAFEQRRAEKDFVWLDPDLFGRCPSNSIDYAVMERSRDVAVVPLDAAWNDIGSWSALWEVMSKDSFGNACTGEVLSIDTRDCLIHSGKNLVVTIGVQDLIIVETETEVLVVHKDSVQRVKEIPAVLKGR